jgi:hypothetical protein
LRFTNETRKIYLTKLLKEPLDLIQSHFEQEIKKINNKDLNEDLKNIKYMIYSAHDTQIANLMTHLTPNFNYTEVDYASNFKIQLGVDNTCVKG